MKSSMEHFMEIPPVKWWTKKYPRLVVHLSDRTKVYLALARTNGNSFLAVKVWHSGESVTSSKEYGKDPLLLPQEAFEEFHGSVTLSNED